MTNGPFMTLLHAPIRRAPALLLVAALSAAACGGTYVPGDGDDSNDSDGSSTGGVPASGGNPGAGGGPSSGGDSGADGGSGGEPGSGGGGGECCLADFQCDEGDTEIDIDSGCPVGAECYAKTVCCETGYCMRQQPICDGIPTCQEGESEVTECPEGWSCTLRALCGAVITCLKDDVCDPTVQPNRDYVASSEAECATVDYSCPEHTTSFTDECGCGCEQPSTCPGWLDCAPGGLLDPLCSSGECPYTQRGL